MSNNALLLFFGFVNSVVRYAPEPWNVFFVRFALSFLKNSAFGGGNRVQPLE